MSESERQRQQINQDGPVPTTRGAADADATRDDTSGQAIMIGGEWFAPPGDDARHPIPPTRVGVSGPSLNPPPLRPPGRIPEP